MLCLRKARWLALASLVACAAVVFQWPEPTREVHIGRTKTWRQRAECKLEDWGLIPVEPFRYVEG